MIGAIRRRDIFVHPRVTARCFGWETWLRALAARNGTTFLSLVRDGHAAELPELVARCAELERRAGQIYGRFAERFSQTPGAADFFARLADDESRHAELLELCGTAAESGRWDQAQFTPWRHVVPSLEQYLDDFEHRSERVQDLREALRLVLELESSDLNHVFLGVVAASDSDFVRALDVFWHTSREHTHRICEEISRMEPSLAEQCKSLAARY
jgi:rubrerythrin